MPGADSNKFQTYSIHMGLELAGQFQPKVKETAMSESMLVAAVSDDLQVSFDPELPTTVGLASGVVLVSAKGPGETQLPVPFQLVGDGTVNPSQVLSAIQESLELNGFQLRATAVRLSQ